MLADQLDRALSSLRLLDAARLEDRRDKRHVTQFAADFMFFSENACSR